MERTALAYLMALGVPAFLIAFDDEDNDSPAGPGAHVNTHTNNTANDSANDTGPSDFPAVRSADRSRRSRSD